MASLRIFIAFLSLTSIGSAAHDPLNQNNYSAKSCQDANANKDWPIFIDPVRRFCFHYPPSYHQVASRVDCHVGDGKVVAKFESRELRRATQLDKGWAAIIILFSAKPFKLQSFVSEAPTGVEAPPEPVHWGALTFFRYGAGGGGVAYDDYFYFNLHNQILKICFDGPFDGSSKSPSDRTQRIEKEMLSTFQAF